MLAPQVPDWVLTITLLAINNPTQTSRAVISARADVDTINSMDIIKHSILMTLILIPFGNMSITNRSTESMTYLGYFFFLDFLGFFGDLATSEYSLPHITDGVFGDFFREMLFISSAVIPLHQHFSILFFFIYTDHEALDDLSAMIL